MSAALLARHYGLTPTETSALTPADRTALERALQFLRFTRAQEAPMTTEPTSTPQDTTPAGTGEAHVIALLTDIRDMMASRFGLPVTAPFGELMRGPSGTAPSPAPQTGVPSSRESLPSEGSGRTQSSDSPSDSPL